MIISSSYFRKPRWRGTLILSGASSPILTRGLPANTDSNHQNTHWAMEHFLSMDFLEPPHKPLRSLRFLSRVIDLETETKRSMQLWPNVHVNRNRSLGSGVLLHPSALLLFSVSSDSNLMMAGWMASQSRKDGDSMCVAGALKIRTRLKSLWGKPEMCLD